MRKNTTLVFALIGLILIRSLAVNKTSSFSLEIVGPSTLFATEHTTSYCPITVLAWRIGGPSQSLRCDKLSSGFRRAAILPVLSGFLWRNPATIPRFVVAIIVDAVDHLPYWSASHISNKVFKIVDPRCTDFYSTTTVARIAKVPYVAASFLHSSPAKIFRRVGKTMLDGAEIMAFYKPFSVAISSERGLLTTSTLTKTWRYFCA